MIPFLVMIFTASKPKTRIVDADFDLYNDMEKISLNICLATQCFFFLIELI